jgi:hypothetical protein
MPRALFIEPDEDDAFDFVEEREPARPRKPLPWLRFAIISGIIVAGLVHLAQKARQDPEPVGVRPIPSAVLIAPAPAWKPLGRPTALYGVEKSDSPAVFEARLHASGGQEDTITIGAFGDAGYSRIRFASGLTEPQGRSLFVETARRAADAGLSVIRDAPSRMLKTKFGALEAASMTLSGPMEQSCHAFRFVDPTAEFSFHGWLCGGDARSVDDAQLSCFVDRITLMGGDDLTLKAIFAEADAKPRTLCPPPGPAPARTAAMDSRLDSRLTSRP